ncbi:MAG: Ig-like domain-containing protein [Ignavibacteria bacterium]
MNNFYLKFAFLIACILNTAMIYSSPINQYINTVTPSQNAVSVNKASNITIVFTQDMNPATINNANIKVFGYQTGLLPVTIDYNAAGKTANINPNQDLKAGEKISVTLTSGIKTIANENIAPFVYTFYVQATEGTGYLQELRELITSQMP